MMMASSGVGSTAVVVATAADMVGIVGPGAPGSSMPEVFGIEDQEPYIGPRDGVGLGPGPGG